MKNNNDEDTSSATNASSSAMQPELSRVSVKCPQFWKDNPAIWFSQIESQFITSGITQDSTKYHIVVASVETDILAQVSDIITSPPATNMYLTLKTRLIEVFSDSEERRLKKLLQDVDLGDKRPSVLLRQMQDLAGIRLPDSLLKSLWLQRLPTQMQAILTTSSEDLNKLAIMADKIADVTSFNEVNATQLKSNTADNTSVNDMIANLQAQIGELSKKLENLSDFRGRSNSRNRSKSRDRSKERHKLCWYHFRFKEKALKCIKPCAYKSEN